VPEKSYEKIEVSKCFLERENLKNKKTDVVSRELMKGTFEKILIRWKRS